MKNPKISLVIPAHNEEKYIGTCLKYAIKNSGGNFFEIIIVDNASTDKTAKIALKYPGVRVVHEKNKGLTRARQRGFLEAKGDILAYTDSDTQMPKGWMNILLREFKKNPELACLSGPYIYYDIPKFQQTLVKLFWYILAIPVYYLVGYMAIGGNFVIQKSVLKKMDGFDTTIEFYGEDTNIARRAHEFGKVKFNPHFLIYTSGRRLSKDGLWKTAGTYILNFLSEAVMHKPATKKYRDIR